MQRDSVAQTVKVATILCVICSVVVSSAAVGLRKQQEANKIREMRKNILQAAGVFDETVPVEQQYEQKIQPRIVDLGTGWYDSRIDADTFDQTAVALDPTTSRTLTQSDDIAGIKRRENFSLVYIVEKDGEMDQVVLPIRGVGLWSTLRGFLAIDAATLAAGPDQVAVRGITYYDHKETPGLGGEVDNPDWKATWRGKRLFDKDWAVKIEVSKTADSDYEVDSLSGATITSSGVTNMLRYWLGDSAFGPYLQRLAADQGSSSNPVQ